MKSVSRFALSFPFCFGLVAVAPAAVALGQEYHRGERAEVFVSGQWFTGQSTGFTGSKGVPFTLDIEDFYGGGLGLAYNFTDNLNAYMNWNAGSTSTQLSLGGESVGSNALTLTWDTGVEYNFLKSRFTPFVFGVVGLNWFKDDNVVLPYNGYSVSYKEATFEAGGGGGLRWDFSDHLFLKAFYQVTWNTGLDTFDDDMVFQGAKVMVGYIF